MKILKYHGLETQLSQSEICIVMTNSALIQGASVQALEAAAPIGTPDGHEPYERGMALNNAGLFRQAAEHCEKAVQVPRMR